jgi:hypothetical protein
MLLKRRIQSPRTVISDVKIKSKKKVVLTELIRWVYPMFLRLEPWVLEAD